MAIQYAVTTVEVANTMMGYHWLQRPLMSYFNPGIPLLKSQLRNAAALLEPFLKQRLEQCVASDIEKPDDLMQWLIDSVPERKADVEFHTGIQMEAVQAGTFNLAFQVCDDLKVGNLLIKISS